MEKISEASPTFFTFIIVRIFLCAIVRVKALVARAFLINNSNFTGFAMHFCFDGHGCTSAFKIDCAISASSCAIARSFKDQSALSSLPEGEYL